MGTIPIKEKNAKDIVCRQDLYLAWKQNAPKLAFGEHELLLELDGDDDEFFVQKAKDELRETPEIVDLGFKELRELIAEEPDFYIPEDKDMYKAFLRPCKWYANSAFSLMKRYFKFRLVYPHIYKDLLPTKETIGLCSGLSYPLPIRNTNGCRMLIIEVGKRWKPKEVPLENFFKSLLFLLYLAAAESKTQISGVHIIIDLEGLSLSHLTYLTPSFAKMFLHFAQKCLPCRLKAVHVVRQSFLFNIALAIFKPFLEEKLRKRLFVHGTDWESLMKSSFTDQSMLLTKHGGKLKMPDEPLGPVLWQNILFLEPFLEADLKYGYKAVKNKK